MTQRQGWERERFEQFFHEQSPAVLAYALMRADVQLAKDAAAETFLVAWRRRDDLPELPRAWLIGVTRRALADLRRGRNRQSAVRARLTLVGGPVAPPDDPGELVAQRQAVHAALARLAPDDAELLCLVCWDGLSYRQAAEALGCTTTAVGVRLHRARRRFEQEIGSIEPRRLRVPAIAALPVKEAP